LRAQRLFGLAFAVAATFALGGCSGEDDSTVPSPGTVTVRFATRPFDTAGLTVATARLRIRDLLVIGNVPPPPPPPFPPPPGSAPPPPPPNTRFDFDVLSAGRGVSFDFYPQGLYSRVLFAFDRVTIEGTWNRTPFRVAIGAFMGVRVDLRSATPQELGPGKDTAFEISMDPGTWFASRILDSAMIANGEIVCDEQHNAALAAALNDRIAGSFVLP
jgi:hypothetical protein